MARIGGRGYRRWRMWLAVVGGLLVAATVSYAGVQLASGGLKPSDTAGLLGLPVGVAALAVAAMGLRRLPDGDLAQLARGWTATLAEQVEEDGQRQWRQLIGDDTQRINLAFTLRPELGRAAVVPADVGRLFEGTPIFPDVASYYRRTCPRRLVVTGGPGAGKTVLALELILALIEGRQEGAPVPVRLSLSEWDTTTPLSEWLARHLVDVYDWPAEMAEELIRQRRVLPVLDGLDEMDPTAPDGTPFPNAPRAQAALDALNAYQDGRAAGPVILTCRTRHYEALSSRTRLLDAARIDIDRVTPDTARVYLHQRALDPARWQPVLDVLGRDSSGPLATTLSTPWRLSLAATVYAQDGDPADLLRHTTPADLDEHLLARFIPAATDLHPRPHRPYTAGDVHRWLARLAAYLNTASPAPEDAVGADTGPRTDLVLHQLWPLAGRRRVRATDAVLTTLAVLLPLPLAWATSSPLTFGTLIALSAVLAGSSAAGALVAPPRRVHWGRLRTKAGSRGFAGGFAGGLGGGLAIGLAFGLAFGLLPRLAVTLGDMPAQGLGAELAFGAVSGLSSGSAAGLASGFTSAIGSEPPTSARPRDVLRSDLLRGLAVGLGVGLAFVLGVGLALVLGGGFAVGFVSGLGAGLVSGLGARLAFVLGVGLASGYGFGFGYGYGLVSGLGIAGGIAGGIAFGLGIGLALGAPSGRRYLVFVLCAKGKLPRRLGVFLDWACTAGLLRLAGAAYQFRHRELQQWLACHPSPPPV
ncbi:NACHT domain-containing protein [Streptomyces sp. NPDC054794]